MIKIGFLLIDGFALMSYSSVVEPLRAANLLSEKQLYDLKNISAFKSYSYSSGGAKIETQSIKSILFSTKIFFMVFLHDKK